MKGNGLFGPVRAWLLRPQVVHRLPGRLRLRIPALRRLAGEPNQPGLVWRDLRIGPNRIDMIEVNLTTGSVLIHYRSKELTEDELLGFLRAVNRLALKHWNRLTTVPAADLPAVLERLAQAVGMATSQRLALKGDIQIPNHVWCRTA